MTEKSEVKKVTLINLPHKALARVGKVLEKAGFTLGTVGGGYGEMERDGEISDEEVAKLKLEMADLLFEFDTYDFDEDEDED